MKKIFKIVITLAIIIFVIVFIDIIIAVKNFNLYKELKSLSENTINNSNNKNYLYEEQWNITDTDFEKNSLSKTFFKNNEILIIDKENESLNYLAYKNPETEFSQSYLINQDLDYVIENIFEENIASQELENLPKQTINSDYNFFNFLMIWNHSISKKHDYYVEKIGELTIKYSIDTGLIIERSTDGMSIKYSYNFDIATYDLHELFDQEYTNSKISQKDTFEAESYYEILNDIIKVLSATNISDLQNNVLIEILNNAYNEKEINSLIFAIINEENTATFDGDSDQPIIAFSSNGEKLINIILETLANQELDRKDRILLLNMLINLRIDEPIYKEKINNAYNTFIGK